MTMRLTFGIDPGLTGAIATLIDGEAGLILDMPTAQVGDWREVDARALALWIREQRAAHPGAYVSACIEKVGAFPGDGGTSAFRFGDSYGGARAVLQVLGIPYTRAIPAVWKRRFGLLGQDKDAARLLALQRFPSAADALKRKKDNGRADALLLALYHEQGDVGARAA
ncbi:hypothetical protein HEP73_02149 [Xanthomonas sp. GW]|uniref:hypothetical protein n=1 Tax=Xanthomonas sp. GW TaxID=2724121 RepID=UPI00163B0FE5|nr:hypothetical protein [Xanthomonas sp. GW]QNH21237.1 hypothetical protein HEP73_02149 [Xanthomonas sp. GW]